MSMPLIIEWRLVTHGKEKRLKNQKNMFEIRFNQYKFFPINQRIEISRHDDSAPIGCGKIVELIWNDKETICKYQLVSLYNVN
ncbi:DUF2584 family protein [Aquibacillus albus]|uniref:DUF2584 family protein n=1 Tax=Aquibacillus albus TaxID=1168171 RepID=A0ABS2MVM6_9BACI|nr:DUF2584 family protein [Aquibacillus albus]MBM7569890.1 hypothetical protein [Aquibacillus albus]